MSAAAPVVWRGLTAEQVQQQYDMRVAVPDGERFTLRRIDLSKPVRAMLAGPRDIRYGAGPRQLVDVYPAADEDGPIVIFFHGGAWRHHSKDVFAFVARPLVEQGITTVIPGFDLHPQASLRQMMAQAREAVAWTASMLGLDGRRRLVVSGHSSGAQLAAMALAYDFRRHGLAQSPIRGALLISGSYDLEPHRHHPRYADLGLDEDLVLEASPTSNPPLDTGVTMMLAVGADETAGYQRQADVFRDRCAARGHQACVLRCTGDHHYSVVERLADASHPMTAALVGLARGEAAAIDSSSCGNA